MANQTTAEACGHFDCGTCVRWGAPGAMRALCEERGGPVVLSADGTRFFGAVAEWTFARDGQVLVCGAIKPANLAPIFVAGRDAQAGGNE